MKSILVGVDLSPRAADVFAAAFDLARRFDARLSVIRAVSLPIEFPIEALTVAPDGLPTKLLDITQRGLDAFVASVPRDAIERSEARLGSPWQVLCDAAKEIQSDLIVIGTHGHSILDRLLGTTAARVVNHAPCSVYVVRSKIRSDRK